jgi:STE24 endopeptidase
LRRRLERRQLALAAAAVVAAGVCALAASALWRTRVPGDLALPDLDPRDYFTRTELREAGEYERVVQILFVVQQVAILAVLAAYARWGGRFARESAAGRIGTGMLLGMLGLALLWLTLLPFGLTELWWQRRHDISRTGYSEWIFGSWLGLGGEFLFICLALAIVMGLARPLPRWWWLPGGAVFVGLALLFAFVYPYLGGGERLRDPELVADARQLAHEQGISPVPVEVADVGTETTAPNAEAAGLGASRRIILWDTLLDGRFDDGEIRVVLAHELAHHSSAHVWKSVGWYALFAFPGALVIALVTRRRGGMRRPEAVPLGLFTLVVLSFLALPAENAISRHLEAEADWVALETTEDPRDARELFERFSTTLRTEPDPPGWAYVFMDTHPELIDRIAMTEAWEERTARGR